MNINSIPEVTILVKTIVVGLYPNNFHKHVLRALEEVSEKWESNSILTENFIKMAKFLLKNIFSEFYGDVKQQVSGKAIRPQFAHPYSCIFEEKIKEILQSQECQLLVWLKYIDYFLFVLTYIKENHGKFLFKSNKFHPDLKFTYESSQENITLLDLAVKLLNSIIATDLHIKENLRSLVE